MSKQFLEYSTNTMLKSTWVELDCKGLIIITFLLLWKLLKSDCSIIDDYKTFFFPPPWVSNSFFYSLTSINSEIERRMVYIVVFN